MNLKSMGKVNTRRNKYQHHTKMTLKCRICLTQSNNVMFKLEHEFEFPEGEFVSYLKALEDVTTSKVVLNGDYPENICPMCASVLKMSLKFIRQFKDSQMELRKQFNYTDVEEPEYENLSVKVEEVDNTPHVELIFQNNTFSINDLLVVEKQETEDCDFKGFLENLGKEVTATFVEEFDQKKPQDLGKEDMISVSVIDKNRIIPVRQLQIDEDANLIEYVLDENPINIGTLDEQLDEVSRASEHSSNENDNESLDGKNMSDGQNENIEYIEIDILDQDAIDSLIIDRTEFVNSQTESISNNETPRSKKVCRVGKRRKKQTTEVEDEFEKEVKFPCEICRNIFATSSRLRAHKNRVHFRKERTFACEICGYLCRTRSAFVHHKFTHEEKQFKCHLCNKAYHTKAVLKVHIGTHANKRQNLCNVCGKGFNYPNALSYHMRLHTGEKNYHCDFCDRSFRMPNSLTRHRRTHTGDKPYSCRFCNRSFCSKGEVKCHEYIHTGYRPYHCKYCRKGFSKTHNLKLHLLSHKGSHQCEICDRSFIEPAILKMHYKISHKTSQNEGESSDSQRGNSNVVIMDYVEYKQVCE